MLSANESLIRQTAITLGLVMSLVFSPALFACMCPEPQFEREFEKAHYVFQAVVTAIEALGIEETGFIDLEELRKETDESTVKVILDIETIRVSFDVIRNYKGDASALKHLYAFTGDSICGLHISIDAIGIFIINESGHLLACGPSWFGNSHPYGFTIDQIEELSLQYIEEHNKSLNTDASDAGAG